MDGNKDDALKCLKIGKEALKAGDRARSLKFVNKARRLDPTLHVDDLIAKIQCESDQGSGQDSGKDLGSNTDAKTANGPSGSSSAKSTDPPSLRRRISSNGSSSASSTDATYTEEQITLVREIKRKKNYYEILGLEKSCTVEDVRKAYRKLSLKVHPDKNTAPGAEEAFKVVSRAFQCLSNEESRKKYDLVGSDEPVYERRPTRHGAHGCNGYYDSEFDAEEIFRNFFYGGMGPMQANFSGFNFGPRMAQRTADHGSTGFNMRALIQILPILLILLLNFLPSSEPVYSLSRTYPYEHRFTTQRGVNYYVKSAKFEQDYPSNSHERQTLEGKIEREYFNILAQNCRLELQRRQWGFIRETPHCDMLQQFESVA